MSIMVNAADLPANGSLKRAVSCSTASIVRLIALCVTVQKWACAYCLRHRKSSPTHLCSAFRKKVLRQEQLS